MKQPPVDELADFDAPTPEELRAELGRREFREFVRLLNPEFEPIPWHHEKVIAAIQAWADSPDDDPLVVSLPPGTGKSYLAQHACAWLAVRNRDRNIAYCGYAQEFSESQLRRAYGVMESDRFLDHYAPLLAEGRTRGDDARSNKGAEWMGGEGSIRAVGRGAGLTGRRLDDAIIDDILKDVAEARSATIRQVCWDWLTGVVNTRRTPGRLLKRLIIATRWDPDDLSGRVLSTDPNARELKIAAIKVGPPTADDPREDGESIWPAAWPIEALEKERHNSPHLFAALFQQDPIPSGGRLFAAHDFRTFELASAGLDWDHGTWYQSWDFRGGGPTDSGSYAVGLLAFRPHARPSELYIVDMVRERWSSPDSLTKYCELQSADWWGRTSIRLIELAADGKMIIDQTRHRWGITAIKPSGDKWLRASAVTPFIKQGQVFILAVSWWRDAFLAEVSDFPGSPNDDIVDALSQLLSHIWGIAPSAAKARVAARGTTRQGGRSLLRRM